MKKIVKWLTLLVGLTAVLAGVIWWTNRPAAPKVTPEQSKSTLSVAPLTGSREPLFSLPGYPDNKPISLKDYQGKPVLINFWASWCPPCQAETPDLVKANAQYGNKVQFIGVNLTSQDTLTDVTSFIRQYGIKYPVALDTKGTAAQQYQVLAIPTSIFVNRQGVIVDRYVGAITPKELEGDLQKISQQ